MEEFAMENKNRKDQIEDIFLRFSHVGEQIFDQLDNENLVNCKGISRVWCSIIDNSKIVWRRKIQRFYENHVEFHQHWKHLQFLDYY